MSPIFPIHRIIKPMVRIIAFATMLIDHIGIIFFPDLIFFRIVGRLALPLFCWGIAVGFNHTHNKYKYLFRLFLLSIVSQLPYSMLFCNGYLNICFGLSISLVALIIFDSNFHLLLKGPGIILLLGLSVYFNIEYGFYSILTVLLFHVIGCRDSVIYYHFLLTLITVLFFKLDPIQLFASFSVLLILLLKKYDYRIPRVVQYGFYPLHLTVIFLILNGGLL